MKRACLYALLALGVAVWSAPAAVADPADTAPAAQKADKGKKKSKKADKDAADEGEAALSPMAQALSKVKCYTAAKPSLKAKYYIMLFSTSTCAHCNRTMPGNVELYRQMHLQGDVELMLVTLTNMDNADAALGFLNKYGAPFAGATDTEMKAAGVPVVDKVNANGPGTILALPPYIVIVDSEGNVVHQGPGSQGGRNMMEDWKQHTIGEDAVIPEPTAAEKKAAEKQAKEAAKAAAKAEKERAKAEKKKGKKKK